jgi:uncharacterized protein YqjF (DUF2071 family)
VKQESVSRDALTDRTAVASETARFSSRRDDGVDFAAVYRPASASDGALERCLTDRYSYDAQPQAGATYRCDIAHQPWALARAEAHITRNALTRPFGVALEGEPLTHYAAHMDTRVRPILRVG